MYIENIPKNKNKIFVYTYTNSPLKNENFFRVKYLQIKEKEN